MFQKSKEIFEQKNDKIYPKSSIGKIERYLKKNEKYFTDWGNGLFIEKQFFNDFLENNFPFASSVLIAAQSYRKNLELVFENIEPTRVKLSVYDQSGELLEEQYFHVEKDYQLVQNCFWVYRREKIIKQEDGTSIKYFDTYIICAEYADIILEN